MVPLDELETNSRRTRDSTIYINLYKHIINLYKHKREKKIFSKKSNKSRRSHRGGGHFSIAFGCHFFDPSGRLFSLVTATHQDGSKNQMEIIGWKNTRLWSSKCISTMNSIERNSVKGYKLSEFNTLLWITILNVYLFEILCTNCLSWDQITQIFNFSRFLTATSDFYLQIDTMYHSLKNIALNRLKIALH